jgi:hypothetical protein
MLSPLRNLRSLSRHLSSPLQCIVAVQDKWEQASEAVVALCQRSGARQGRVMQTANLLLQIGFEGAAPGTRCLSLEGPRHGQLIDLPRDRGLVKLITVLVALCHTSSKENMLELQKLSDSQDQKTVKDLERLAGVVFMSTRLVADAINAVIVNPEDWCFQKCSSLTDSMLPLLEGCLSTLDAALSLQLIARKLQVPCHHAATLACIALHASLMS